MVFFSFISGRTLCPPRGGADPRPWGAHKPRPRADRTHRNLDHGTPIACSESVAIRVETRRKIPIRAVLSGGVDSSERVASKPLRTITRSRSRRRMRSTCPISKFRCGESLRAEGHQHASPLKFPRHESNKAPRKEIPTAVDQSTAGEQPIAPMGTWSELQNSVKWNREFWRARRDSNSRPPGS